MPKPIPNEWLADPPTTLLAGEGPYAQALGSVLGTETISLSHLKDGPESSDAGGYSQVLENMAQAILVVSESMSAAEAMQCHQAVWDWIRTLSSSKDQHELVFLFDLPADASQEFEDAIAVGLGVAKIDPASTGHAVWRRFGSLSEMLHVLANIRPMDLLPLQARQAANAKHTAIAGLRELLTQDSPTAVSEAARQVQLAFSGHEYLLDLFCRPPSHRNGNLLRGWLNASVTSPVTQDGWAASKQHLVEWLA